MRRIVERAYEVAWELREFGPTYVYCTRVAGGHAWREQRPDDPGWPTLGADGEPLPVCRRCGAARQGG